MRTGLPQRVAIFVVGAIVLASAFVGIAYYFVTTRSGQLLDQRAFNGAEFGQRSVAPVTLSLLDALPVTGVAVALAAAIVVTIVRRNWFVLFVAVSSAGLANLLTQLVKHVFLVRPDHDVSGYALNSLPSGHTALAASSVMVVFLVSSQRARPMIATFGGFYAVAVGVSTLANQWHRPSDVVAALLLVAFFGCVAGLVLIKSRFTADVPARDLWSRFLLLLSLPCAGVAAATLLVSAFAPFAYVGAAAGIATLVLLLAVAANHAFRMLR